MKNRRNSSNRTVRTVGRCLLTLKKRALAGLGIEGLGVGRYADGGIAIILLKPASVSRQSKQ